METDIRKFVVSVDVADLQRLYLSYGQSTVDAAIEKFAYDLRHKIRNAVDIKNQTGVPKTLVETVK